MTRAERTDLGCFALHRLADDRWEIVSSDDDPRRPSWQRVAGSVGAGSTNVWSQTFDLGRIRKCRFQCSTCRWIGFAHARRHLGHGCYYVRRGGLSVVHAMSGSTGVNPRNFVRRRSTAAHKRGGSWFICYDSRMCRGPRRSLRHRINRKLPAVSVRRSPDSSFLMTREQ